MQLNRIQLLVLEFREKCDKQQTACATHIIEKTEFDNDNDENALFISCLSLALPVFFPASLTLFLSWSGISKTRVNGTPVRLQLNFSYSRPSVRAYARNVLFFLFATRAISWP